LKLPGALVRLPDLGNYRISGGGSTLLEQGVARMELRAAGAVLARLAGRLQDSSRTSPPLGSNRGPSAPKADAPTALLTQRHF